MSLKREVAPKSFERYAEVVNGHLVPVLGKLPLNKQTPLYIQNSYNAWADGGRSPASRDLRRFFIQSVGVLRRRPVSDQSIDLLDCFNQLVSQAD